MRIATALTVLVAGASAAPQPQFGGLKKLLNSFSGDEKPGSGGEGDYESVPYETIQVYEVHTYSREQMSNVCPSVSQYVFAALLCLDISPTLSFPSQLVTSA